MELKKKLKLFLVGLSSFIFLFYNHDPGVNIFIFTLIAWLLMVYSQGGLGIFKRDRTFWVLTLFVGLTAGAFSFYGDAGSFFALLLCFYSLGVYLTDKKFQPLLYPLLLAYSLGSFIVRVFFISRWIPKRKRATDAEKDNEGIPTALSAPYASTQKTNITQSNLQVSFARPSDATPVIDTRAATNANTAPIKIDVSHEHTLTPMSPVELWLKTWLLPIGIILLFVIVYMSSSSLFSNVLIRFIPNLDFPMLYFVTIAGFYFLFNFMYILPIPWFYTLNDKITGWDAPIDEQNTEAPTADRLQYLAGHQKAATITLSLLIGLLSVFILIYSYELYRGIHAARLSQAVHEQVNSIILSIVMAVGVILYYIRPEKQPTENNSHLESIKTTRNANAKTHGKLPLLDKLAYGWILLNVILVISAAMHNMAYVGRYGLTQLRIGVYIFLCLCLIGLYYTYIKIKQKRSAAYLVATMFKVFIATIALSSVINWSSIITRYNLKYMARPDLNYLLRLEYNGLTITPLLMQDPRYKNDQKLKDRILNKLYWDGAEAKNNWLSTALYYNFEMYQLKKQGYLKP